MNFDVAFSYCKSDVLRLITCISLIVMATPNFVKPTAALRNVVGGDEFNLRMKHLGS